MSEAPEPARVPVAWMSEVQVAPVARMIRDSLVRIGVFEDVISVRRILGVMEEDWL